MSDVKTESLWLMKGDCLERMKEIPSGSVDLILADPPYGTTACKWDSIIDLPLMWEQLKRIIKPSGAIVMTASQPFTTTLIASNMKMFKYNWVWCKTKKTGFANSKNRPLTQHEDVCIFSNGNVANRSKVMMVYNPQGLHHLNKVRKGDKNKSKGDAVGHKYYRPSQCNDYIQEYTNYPTTLLEIASEGKTVHPTQKPVALMEYLIKTYTNEGETVLDFAHGSGSTGVAAVNTGRKYIGIEMDETYFEVSVKRIMDATNDR